MAPSPRPPAPRAHLGLKFALLAAGIFGLALAVLLLIQRTQRQSMAELHESETHERSAMLSRVIELTGRSLRDFTEDYAQWDDMVQFVERPRRRWAAINLDASLETFRLSAVWVLQADGTLVYATAGENGKPQPPLPLSRTALEPLLKATEAATFFSQQPGRLTELCLAPVQPSDDAGRLATPRGWLLAERVWDAAQLRLLAELLQCEVAVAPPGRPLPPAGPTELTLRHPLPGPDGQPAADLIYTIRSRELEIVSHHHRTQVWLFLALCLASSILAVACLHHWVLRPLRAIGESLAHGAPEPIVPLLERRDELGRVAQLVQTSFTQRAALESMLNERVRLARELHDGVIQTVYAAGMNLTGARALLRKNPAESERILDDTYGELNTTIRDLRSFIAGLEPEPASQRSFREAVQSMVTLMQGVRPVECVLDLDDAVGAKLNSSERLNALHIVREAMSNSVRHSAARRLHVALRRQAGVTTLEITDDGTGLDPMLHGEPGRGLANLSARARELGGELRIESEPGAGLRIRVTFPAVR